MTMTQEERISRLEGAFEAFSVVAATMVTKEELRASIEGTQASIDGLRAETTASIDGLRAENHATAEGLRLETRATAETLRAEIRAQIREAELRSTRWTVGAVFTASTIVIAVLKLWP